MGKKEGTNERGLDGRVTPVTNNLADGAMKMSGAAGIIVKCHDGTDGARRKSGQVEESSLGKGGE